MAILRGVTTSSSSAASRAIAGTAAANILARPNVRESRTPIPVTPATNANARESRTSSGGISSITTTPVRTVVTSSSGSSGSNIGGGGGSLPVQTPPPSPKPPTAGELGVVKTPGRDVTRISDLVQQTPADTIKRLAFEQLSAIELSQILTSSTVDGIDQKYSIISNLSDIRKRYDASTNLSIMNKNTPMTGVYNIDIDSKIPGFTYILQNNLFSSNYYVDIDNSLNSVEKGYIYIDTNGDLIIEVDNMKSDEILQVQIVTDGTIYEVTN